MSRHDGVSCDSCLKSNFNGRRYKCLICYDYDLCADCYEDGVTSTRHLVEHPMQCILTRSDIELYFGGEMLTSDQPQSFTCPYCKKMGFSDATLLEHVSAEHTETSLEVVCPVCAGLPGGEPNLVTDDFAGHLTLEHRQGPRELISFLDEPSAIRHGGGVRRIPGRTLGGPRTRRSNMHFSSSSGLSALSPSGRESVDPIAELLSQLSGVRRGGPPTSQLQQLQMQMQLDRQQVTASRQIDRLPRRAHPIVSTSNSNAAMAEVISGGAGGSGAVGSGSGGGSGGTAPPNLRTTEWPVTASFSTSASNHSQTQSSLAANSLNAREAIGTSSSAASNALGISVGVGGAANGNGGAGSSGVAAGAAGAGQSGGQGAAVAGESLLLAQFMQPTLSEAEWAMVESMRADRSMFVQSLMLSMLCTEALDLNASDESLAKSDNVNKGQQQQQEDAEAEAQAETLLNNNADVEQQQQQQQQQQPMVRQVNQMQQTSPEDFVCDEYRYKNKKANTTQTSGTGGGGGGGGGLGAAGATAAAGGGASGAGSKPTADRGIERRAGRPPPAEMATGSQQPQQQQQQQSLGNPAASQQKYKQSANAAAAANTNQIPDTR
ncbi:E3 ubiquitin-protein ligase Kcmf1 [Drosophila takahashii]|uniref:E3 ubiquitin-protein ligase Kcmf1 n=1 Tax=Drosophila takahashii TaxID=29030 RepID=UPI001CF7ED85|nr:E3 ubiquitin-protein ligase Kcmf1 [Drosophila takahashii]XP_017000274.2 E3 ubiquitin-protein ligase Kcmf1 [Drosophila takahashii]XP_017000275.2 E3 ubiquitin-protein ligase Kcmf1 [Drosophila takahashii]XP_017000276.2 E3 ubiquitin-protein ligase Kcmf1 [Drosophila takahashii]